MYTRAKLFFMLCFVVVGLLWAGNDLQAGKAETSADVQAAAREGVPDVTDAKEAIADISRFLDGLKTDTTFATNVFNAVKKNDQTGVLNLVRTRALTTTPSIKAIDNTHSFRFNIGFESRKGKQYLLCISSGGNCPNGKNTQLGCINCPAQP